MSSTKTGLAALNDILFEQLERLQNQDISQEELETEIKRANATKSITKQILDGQKLAFKIMEHRDEYGYNRKNDEMPKMLEVLD